FGFEDLGKFTGSDRINQGEDLGILEKFSGLADQAAVFLFDEIQTARSIDEKGPIDRPNLRDLWTFLDTGKLLRDLRTLESYLYSWADRLVSFKSNAGLISQGAVNAEAPRTFDLGFGQWEIDYLRRQLGTSKKWIEEEMAKDGVKFLEWALATIKTRLAAISIADFSRSLIFVSGNLEIFGAM